MMGVSPAPLLRTLGPCKKLHVIPLSVVLSVSQVSTQKQKEKPKAYHQALDSDRGLVVKPEATVAPREGGCTVEDLAARPGVSGARGMYVVVGAPDAKKSNYL